MTLPKTNKSPLKIGLENWPNNPKVPKRKVVDSKPIDFQRLLRLVSGRVWILITWCPLAQHFSWAQLKRKCNWMMQKGMHLFETKKIHLPISAPSLHIINLKNKFNQSRHHTHKQGTFLSHVFASYSSPAKIVSKHDMTFLITRSSFTKKKISFCSIAKCQVSHHPDLNYDIPLQSVRFPMFLIRPPVGMAFPNPLVHHFPYLRCWPPLLHR